MHIAIHLQVQSRIPLITHHVVTGPTIGMATNATHTVAHKQMTYQANEIDHMATENETATTTAAEPAIDQQRMFGWSMVVVDSDKTGSDCQRVSMSFVYSTMRV
jgi:hypothetical protein